LEEPDHSTKDDTYLGKNQTKVNEEQQHDMREELLRARRPAKPELELFQGQVAMHKSRCCGKYFFTWMDPLVAHTQKVK
jgi:hypothetical protein